MTALISIFVRAYHSKVAELPIFDDKVAIELIGEETYEMIAQNMIQGRNYFIPNFMGSDDEALRLIVDKTLAGTPLGRSAFVKKTLKTAVMIGAQQYLIFASGYDTFAYAQPSYAKEISIFEIDLPEVIIDKITKINDADIEIPINTHFIKADLTNKYWINDLKNNLYFDVNKISFCSLLGLTYYLTKQELKELLFSLGHLISKGSSIVFDYPVSDKQDNKVNFQKELAKEANEEMKSSFSYEELEILLDECGFLIYEHLKSDEITKQFFLEYNRHNENHEIIAPENVCYCLAVKQ